MGAASAVVASSAVIVVIAAAPSLRSVLQFDGPVRLVQKCFPTLVLGATKSKRDGRIAARLHWLADEFHTRLCWGATALTRVATNAGAYQVDP